MHIYFCFKSCAYAFAYITMLPENRSYAYVHILLTHCECVYLSCRIVLEELMRTCLSFDPMGRPNFEIIVHSLSPL
jgi:hypothetical protein